jgi:hypothetical protein
MSSMLHLPFVHIYMDVQDAGRDAAVPFDRR